MNIRDAAYHTVHDYPGGAEVLALRLGKAYKTLLKEVAPGPCDSAKFGLLDASKTMALAGDHRILFAMNAEHGFMAVPLPHIAEDGGPCALTVAALAGDFARLMQEVAEGLCDNEVTDNELREIERTSGRLIADVQRLLQHVVSMNEGLKQRRMAPAQREKLQEHS